MNSVNNIGVCCSCISSCSLHVLCMCYLSKTKTACPKVRCVSLAKDIAHCAMPACVHMRGGWVVWCIIITTIQISNMASILHQNHQKLELICASKYNNVTKYHTILVFNKMVYVHIWNAHVSSVRNYCS